MVDRKILLSPLRKALATLAELESEPYSKPIRDAWIKRFEYSLELCWKTLRKVLFERGLEANSPKDVFRRSGEEGLIDDVAVWLDFVDKRNLSSHTYNEETAAEIFQVIPEFCREADALMRTLEGDYS